VTDGGGRRKETGDENISQSNQTIGEANMYASWRALALGSLIAAAATGVSLGADAQAERPLDPQVIKDLIIANRVLANEGVVDAFGHVSVRDPRNPNHYLQTRSLSPYLVTEKDVIAFDLDGKPVDPTVKCGCYLERFIHGEIYKQRPDVNAVIHTHSPTVVPFSIVPKSPLKPILHSAAFLPPEGAPVYDQHEGFGATDMLVANAAMGNALAHVLGNSSVVLMRGHGNAVVGDTIKIATWRAYYTEVNARMLIAAKTLNEPIVTLFADEAAITDKHMQGSVSIDRAWDMWAERLPKQTN
jgi:ribulose-5-phosphate 4-epimerase/fuculose-1-phosphate aldolase